MSDIDVMSTRSRIMKEMFHVHVPIKKSKVKKGQKRSKKVSESRAKERDNTRQTCYIRDITPR